MATLTASALTAALFLQKDMFADAARKAEYIAEVNVANALIENTTAKVVDVVGNSDKKMKAKIIWSKNCNNNVVTTAPNFCVITGDEADSDSQEFEITRNVSDTFSLDEAQYEANQLNVAEVFADNMLKTKKNCDQKVAEVLASMLGTFAGDNLLTDTPGCPADPAPLDWGTTFIPPTYWTPELMYYFLKVKRKNKFNAPFLLDGKNLGFKMWEAMMKAAEANGSGAANMMKVIKYYEDYVNIEAAAPGKTYMIDRGTLAFASRSRWKGKTAQSPIIESDLARIKYSEPSENIKGLTYDVYITTECSGPYKKHNVLVHGIYDLFNGPANCNGGTGVLEFECGQCPV